MKIRQLCDSELIANCGAVCSQFRDQARRPSLQCSQDREVHAFFPLLLEQYYS